jgi:competence protein ComEA
MPTPAERRALFFLSALLVLGGTVRAYAALATHAAPSALETADLDQQIQDVDSARSRTKKPTRKGRRAHSTVHDTTGEFNVPAGAASSQRTPPTERAPAFVKLPRRTRKPRDSSTAATDVHIDMDVATAADIERLPRIGPTLARRIVANRDSLGPFGDLEGLKRVRGIGPALARILAPHVTFSLQPRPHGVDRPDGRGAVRKPRRSRARVSDPP